MRALLRLIGVLLIIFGIVALSYQGIKQQQQTLVSGLNDKKLVGVKEEYAYLNSKTGGGAILIGVGLFLVTRKRK